MRYPLLLIVIICLCQKLSAQDQPVVHQIDKAFQECAARDTSIGNLCTCAFEAYAAWDRLMDKEYKKLIKNMKAEKDKAAMKAAQNSWVAYRDNEFKAYDNMFNRAGANWTRLRAEGRIGIVKTRALQLQQYNEALSKRNH